jgi:hypothetical protein
MLEGFFGILAFFATILALVAGVSMIVISLFTHRPERAWKVGGILLAWIAIYAVVLLLVSFASQPKFLNLGQERCFDEMCYSVKSVTMSHALGQFTAQGDYYIITIQLRSAAQRTAQKPSQPDLFVVDSQGNRYSEIVNAGNGLDLGQPVTTDQLWDQKIQPGEIIVRTVAFDLPSDIGQPGLVVTEGIGLLSAVIIGDEGSFFHAKTEFLLTP